MQTCHRSDSANLAKMMNRKVVGRCIGGLEKQQWADSSNFFPHFCGVSTCVWRRDSPKIGGLGGW